MAGNAEKDCGRKFVIYGIEDENRYAFLAAVGDVAKARGE